MAETITLDPSAVATSTRAEFDITPFISVEGVDWGDAQITAQIADGQYGGDPVDYQVPNRTVTMPLKLMARGTFTFEQARRNFQAKTTLMQKEGGWLSRVTAAGTLFADVVNASLTLGGDWLQANRSADVNASLTLECKPDWYGAEITLDDKTETSALALTTVLKLSAADAVIGGDHPARVRVVVDEDDSDTQLGLIWGFRSRYYDAATTAALTYEAEALTPLDAATRSALTGASGGTVVTHATLRTDWTAVLSTTMLAGTANLTHRGSYRCWARCYSTSATPPSVRIVWSIGDLVNPAENTRQTIPGASNFYWRNLGEVRLDAPPTGTHFWRGQIEAIGEAGGENVSIDAVHFVPVDDGYGILRAPQIIGTPTSYSATDSFTSTAAGTVLNGRVAPVGGTWATSGDATDYAFSDDLSAETAKRSAVSGTNGRYAILGATTFTDVQVEALVYQDATPSGTNLHSDLGVIARWTDSSNYLRGELRTTDTLGSHDAQYIRVYQVLAGVETLLATYTVTTFPVFNTWYSLRLVARANGQVMIQLLDSTKTTLIASAVGASASLATAGGLASGKNGLFDRNTSTTVIARYYDDFRVAIPPALDATLYPGRSAQLRTDDILRENAGGGGYAKAPHVGSMPRLPASGLEARKVELYVKASRGDFDEIPDTGIDDISARVSYRPCWLTAPGS